MVAAHDCPVQPGVRSSDYGRYGTEAGESDAIPVLPLPPSSRCKADGYRPEPLPTAATADESEARRCPVAASTIATPDRTGPPCARFRLRTEQWRRQCGRCTQSSFRAPLQDCLPHMHSAPATTRRFPAVHTPSPPTHHGVPTLASEYGAGCHRADNHGWQQTDPVRVQPGPLD